MNETAIMYKRQNIFSYENICFSYCLVNFHPYACNCVRTSFQICLSNFYSTLPLQINSLIPSFAHHCSYSQCGKLKTQIICNCNSWPPVLRLLSVFQKIMNLASKLEVTTFPSPILRSLFFQSSIFIFITLRLWLFSSVSFNFLQCCFYVLPLQINTFVILLTYC